MTKPERLTPFLMICIYLALLALWSSTWQGAMAALFLAIACGCFYTGIVAALKR